MIFEKRVKVRVEDFERLAEIFEKLITTATEVCEDDRELLRRIRAWRALRKYRVKV